MLDPRLWPLLDRIAKLGQRREPLPLPLSGPGAPLRCGLVARR